jgi:hypothetical protein
MRIRISNQLQAIALNEGVRRKNALWRAVASALTFFYHGSAILFGAFGGPGPDRFASAMHAPVAICS